VSGILLLFLLIIISALPLAAALLWFSLAKILHPPWLIASVLGGMLSLPLAGFLQALFPAAPVSGLASLLVRLFLQIALTEEAGRLAVLAVLLTFFRAAQRRSSLKANLIDGAAAEPFTESQAAAAGLITGFSFALVETIYYGAGGLGIALLRAVTAAPLHGACGSRVAAAVYHIPARPPLALSRFLAAVFIHGSFNFIVLRPNIPHFIPVILTAAVLLPSLKSVQRGKN
jgi:hypothetical protein